MKRKSRGARMVEKLRQNNSKETSRHNDDQTLYQEVEKKYPLKKKIKSDEDISTSEDIKSIILKISKESIDNTTTDIESNTSEEVISIANRTQNNSEIVKESIGYHESCDRLTQIVKYFDIVILRLRSKDQTPYWTIIQENLMSYYNLKVSLHDLSVIITIDSSLYRLEWCLENAKKTSDYSLIVSIATTKHQDDRLIVPKSVINIDHSSRLLKFSELAEEWFRNGGTIDNVTTHSMIPPKPDPLALKSIRQVNNIAKELMKKKQYEETKRVQEFQQFSNGDLSGLRDLARHREQQSTHRMKLLENQNKKVHELKNLEILNRLVMIIREQCLQQKQNHFSVNRFVYDQAETSNTSIDDMRSRLQLLSRLCPNFIHICSSNDLVHEETMRININCPLQSIKQLIATSIGDLIEI